MMFEKFDFSSIVIGFERVRRSKQLFWSNCVYLNELGVGSTALRSILTKYRLRARFLVVKSSHELWKSSRDPLESSGPAETPILLLDAVMLELLFSRLRQFGSRSPGHGFGHQRLPKTQSMSEPFLMAVKKLYSNGMSWSASLNSLTASR